MVDAVVDIHAQQFPIHCFTDVNRLVNIALFIQPIPGIGAVLERLFGQVGTSDGCLAVEVDQRPIVADWIRDGGFVYAGQVSLHERSVADGLSSQAACEAVRLKPENGPQPAPPPS